MGPITFHDDAYLTMTPAERREARKARRERFFPRDLATQLMAAQAIEAPLIRAPQPVIAAQPVIEVEPAPERDPFKEWMDRWKAQQAEQDETAPPKCPDVRTIQRKCCEHFNVKLIDILSARRTANVVRPRQIAMYLCKTVTLKSLPDIGRRFGGRDHTTVLHAVRKIEAMIARDEKFAAKVEAIKQELQVA